jgi:protein-S-isoprenylcysteine O-methyltransferase Ste14
VRAILVVISIGWLVFWVGWLIAAFGAKSSQGRLCGFGRLAGLRVGLAVVVVYLVRANTHGTHKMVVTSPLFGGIGLAVWLAGLGLAIWARFYIGANWGMPMTKRVDPDLVTTGPYRLIRHPIYAGIVLALVGTALASSLYLLIAGVVVVGYFLFSATREERFLAERFHDTFPPYKARTKMLIPFVV